MAERRRAAATPSFGRLGPAMTDDTYSRQRALQQAADIVIGQIYSAVHAGVIPGKARGGEQLCMLRRHGIERGGSRQQRQLFDRQPRYTLAVGTVERLA